jgi:predicted RNA-binding protein
MCLSTVYEAGNSDKPLAEYVTGVKEQGEEITFTDITGTNVVAQGAIKDIDLIKNIITFQPTA